MRGFFRYKINTFDDDFVDLDAIKIILHELPPQNYVIVVVYTRIRLIEATLDSEEEIDDQLQFPYE